jgi:dienelactone hydrolase
MKLTRIFILALLGTFGFSQAQAEKREIVEQVVEYKEGKTVLEGFVAYPKDVKKAPGVLVVHAWKGLDEYTKKRARMLAEMGYVAFAADIYGKGVRASTVEEASKLAAQYREGDRKVFRKRVNAGLDQLKKMKEVDQKSLAAVGYCFGGTAVLELARSGAKLNGVVSFHGNLSTPNPKDASRIKAKVLVLHGGDDPYVPPAEVNAFQEEMRNAKVDWQFIAYGGAVHSFTHFDDPGDVKSGAAYNEAADKRSWMAMRSFFNEIF